MNWRFTDLFHTSEEAGRERYRRAAVTASASLLQRGLTIVIGFVSVPLTMNYLGAERYGVWMTISSIMLWMALADFGLTGSALVNVLSEAIGKNDRRAAREFVASAVWTLMAVATLLAIVISFFFGFIPWSSVFHVHLIPPVELQTACGIVLVFFLINLPLSVQNAIYSAHQDGFLANLWGGISNLLALATLITVTRFRGGLPQLVLALSGAGIVIGIASFYYLFFRRYRWLLPLPSCVRWHRIQRLFSLGSKYMAIQVGAFGMLQSQPLMITQILGPASVVPYVVAQKILSLPMDVAYMCTVPLVPAYGEAKVRNDWKWIKRAYRNTTVGSLVIGVPVLVLMALIARPLIRVWAGESAVPEVSLVFWLALYNVLGVALMASAQLLTGTEKVNPLTVSVLLCALGTIGFGSMFALKAGLPGVAAGMVLSKFITFWPLQLMAVRNLFLAQGIHANEAKEAIG